MESNSSDGHILESNVRECFVCKSTVILHNRFSEITIYTRCQGPLLSRHIEKRCSNTKCRIGYRYGYRTVGKDIIYDKLRDNKYIVTSCQTAFEVMLLHRLALEVQHAHMPFEAFVNTYNELDILDTRDYTPRGTENTRERLVSKRLVEAYFLYILLEYKDRYSMQFTMKASIDETLELCCVDMSKMLHDTWSKHTCQVRGCGKVLVIDGGMKVNRKICAARTSGLLKFHHSKVHTVVGCTKMPSPGNKFCPIHMNSNTPSVTADTLPSDHIKRLRKEKGEKKKKGEKTDEDVFNVVGIHDYRRRKIGNKKVLVDEYLVEWEGYDEKTWENEKNIPMFIVSYYNKTGKNVLPSPKVKHVKMAGGVEYVLLTWSDVDYPDEYIKYKDLIVGNTNEDSASSKCRTEKHHGARFCKTTAGILIGCYPCGVIPLFKELYGTESISQVYGQVVEWLGDTNASLDYLLYDDACHLGPYSIKPIRANDTPATVKLAGVTFAVDKMHFKGHVAQFCHDNFNPYALSDLKDVNTPICEQTFRWVNGYKQLKAMNEFRYQVYLMYNIDVYNLKKCCRLREIHPSGHVVIPDISSHLEALKINETTEMDPPITDHLIDGLMSAMSLQEVASMENKLAEGDSTNKTSTNCDSPSSSAILKCRYCDRAFSSKSGMSRHISTKHESVSGLTCYYCRKSLKGLSGLSRHIQSMHPEETSRSIKCMNCVCTFDDECSLLNHVESVHST